MCFQGTFCHHPSGESSGPGEAAAEVPEDHEGDTSEAQQHVETEKRIRNKVLKLLMVSVALQHLRKLNNFNSYLSILSALDSAPLRRLDWQRNTAEV